MSSNVYALHTLLIQTEANNSTGRVQECDHLSAYRSLDVGRSPGFPFAGHSPLYKPRDSMGNHPSGHHIGRFHPDPGRSTVERRTRCPLTAAFRLKLNPRPLFAFLPPPFPGFAAREPLATGESYDVGRRRGRERRERSEDPPRRQTVNAVRVAGMNQLELLADAARRERSQGG